MCIYPSSSLHADHIHCWTLLLLLPFLFPLPIAISILPPPSTLTTLTIPVFAYSFPFFSSPYILPPTLSPPLPSSLLLPSPLPSSSLQAAAGQAIDRHLLGLMLLSREAGMEQPAIFQDPAFQRSMHFCLSTSQVGTDGVKCYRIAGNVRGMQFS